ncbi:MAG TPA: amidohydrolase [Chthoniobacteraceae bacterium]|jgi:hippurate hydrolase|nr:amidohydrolase [Chthoniobacteraceae bacterium]
MNRPLLAARSGFIMLLFLLAVDGRAQQTAAQLAEAELPSLVAIYKELHAAPELSMHEEQTAAVMARELRAAGCAVTEHVGTYDKPGLTCFGVIGVLKNGAGPTVAVRTDLDGLPVLEETGLPYASKVFTTNDEGRRVPVMHACGHDTHMAAFIGTARLLAQTKSSWHGTVVFIGQPAEESVNGARALLKGGLYTRFPKPDFVLGMHDEPELAAGQLGFTEGYAFASSDAIDVLVHGIGGHGAYPHKTKDPVVLSAQIITAWQTIASRQNNPLDPLVISVGSISGGTRYNIIPDEVKMQLTLRTYKKEVREKALAAIQEVATGCAIAAGLPSDKMPEVRVRDEGGTPATYNNPDLTRRIAGVFRETFGPENVIQREPQMGAEDFTEYSLPDHSIPAFMFRFGAVDPAKVAEAKRTGASLPGLHSSKFAPLPEPAIRTAMRAMTGAVLELLKK